MSDHTELRVHHFLAEGRDESKSHVLLEITQPAPNELATHGHFFAIGELSNATPKTIQMVRAWIEFAIEAYYKAIPTSIDAHFETILSQLNTQSSLYLKQHPSEIIHMAIASVCNETLYLAVHGKPSALLFFKKQDAWNCMNLVDPQSSETPGQLFSNVVTGAMRPDDRFLLATPRVTEFFSADRIAKISDSKTMSELNDHMDRVLNELSSDYSFAGTWLSLAKIITPEQPEASAEEQKPDTAPEPKRVPYSPTKKADSSMSELLSKTKNTSAILAPPVLTIPKDKIITNVLKLAQKGIESGGKAMVSATKVSITYVKSHKDRLQKSETTTTALERFQTSISRLGRSYATLPKKRRIALIAGISTVIIAGGAIGSVAWMRNNSATATLTQSQIESIRVKLQSADESFMYQNEDLARAVFGEAETLFLSLPEKTRVSPDGISLSSAIESARNKIYRLTPISFQPIGAAQSINIRDIVLAGNTPIALEDSGTISIIKDSVTSIGTASGATKIYYDESNKRIISQNGTTFTAFTTDGKPATSLSVTRAPNDTSSDAVVFYSGRLYSYTASNQTITRYDGSGSSYDSSRAWITDASKPQDVVDMVADTSLWLRSKNGSILKYTAGKLQPFAVTGVSGKSNQFEKLLVGGSGKIYLLNNTDHRILIVERGGKITEQLTYGSEISLRTIALDASESTLFGVTDSGKLVSYSLK